LLLQVVDEQSLRRKASASMGDSSAMSKRMSAADDSMDNVNLSDAAEAAGGTEQQQAALRGRAFRK
jgi:hypothetical protein